MPDSTYVNGDLAAATTDALQLFLNEAGRYPLLTAREEVELVDRTRRHGCQRADDQLQSPPGRLDRQALPGSRSLAARPDPGGNDRADPGRGEVRLATRFQVLHLSMRRGGYGKWSSVGCRAGREQSSFRPMSFNTS
ncbi:MAG: hypothetical protein H0W87_02855 [Actinobacteria bacterium]|nr:hypothetical protein [Actinomycetota bacterium]